MKTLFPSPPASIVLALAHLAAALTGPAQAQTYVFDTGDTEYAYSMGFTYIPGELAMLQGFEAQGPGSTDVLAEVQAAVGTATQPAGALDGLLIVIAIWNDPSDDYDPTDAELLYSAAPVLVVQSNTDIKIPYAVPGVPVQGVFFIGAVVQDMGTFPAGADIDVPLVGHPVAWLVGEGPGASLDLNDLSIASFSPLVMSEGFLLSATGGAQPGSIGTSYCSPAFPNSTGVAGTITATGSPFVVIDDVTLAANSLPPGEIGYFLAGQTQGFFNPPGSSGVICMGGTIARYNQPGNLGQGPSFSIQVDLTAVPQPVGHVAVQPGDTWNFQAWYADGNTNNFTDAVSVTFQ